VLTIAPDWRYNVAQEVSIMPRPVRDPWEPLGKAPAMRGVIPPPQDVLDVIAREEARLGYAWPPEFKIPTLNQLILNYYFEHHSVAWRETPDGPEVLAVDEELEEFFAKTPPEQRRDVHFGQP
jgi:hypothetical protein